jgi:uncharacterized RmlC-like cupin family protein
MPEGPMMDMTDLRDKPTCKVVGAGARFIGKQALSYTPGISAESVGAQGIHLQLVTLPPGGRAKAHKHESHETAIHVLSGESGMADQHVDQMHGAEALPGAIGAGQQLLRDRPCRRAPAAATGNCRNCRI